MPMTMCYHPREDRLDLSFSGNLDLTVASSLRPALDLIDEDLRTCIVDLTDVERVFDSGVALLGVLDDALDAVSAQVVVLADRLDVQRRVASAIGTQARQGSRFEYESDDFARRPDPPARVMPAAYHAWH